MKKNSIYLVIIVVFQMMISSCGYNDMVSKREAVDKAWNDVQSQYQRRMDLIPNLVSAVKAEAKFEQETLTQIAEARARATGMTIDPSKSSPEQMMKWQEAQGQLGMALGRLISVSENYPNLQANQSFKEFRGQYESTENRINYARDNYNEAVMSYNTMIKSIPQNIYAGWFGFTPRQGFEADKAAAIAPKADFDTDKK